MVRSKGKYLFFTRLASTLRPSIPSKEPMIRWQYAYRQCFYMPFMHSEDAAYHDEAVRGFQGMLRDVETLANDTYGYLVKVGDKYRVKAAKLIQEDSQRAKAVVEMNLDFEKAHYKSKQASRDPNLSYRVELLFESTNRHA